MFAIFLGDRGAQDSICHVNEVPVNGSGCLMNEEMSHFWDLNSLQDSSAFVKTIQFRIKPFTGPTDSCLQDFSGAKLILVTTVT